MADDPKSYSCLRCGDTFVKKKDLEKHQKDCEMTIAKRIADMQKTVALLFTNQADMAKKLSSLEKSTQTGELPADDEEIVIDDMDSCVHYAVRDGKLYKYSKDAKTFHLADTEVIIRALVKQDYESML